MNCTYCKMPTVRGIGTKTRQLVRVCVVCNALWRLDERRGIYVEEPRWKRQRPDYIVGSTRRWGA